MRQLLNTLFVTSEDIYLSLDGENVVANCGGEAVARYPLHTLQSIVSFSYAGASPALMGACAHRSRLARGAWVEIPLRTSPPAPRLSSCPARGAWVEIIAARLRCVVNHCRAPQGARGLKYDWQREALMEF